MILGIDEAGRGPWAGPLVVGAVVLGGVEIDGLTDSKKLTKKRREELYAQIVEAALAAHTGWVSSREIDELGLPKSLRLATRRAVEQVKVPFHEIIIDGTVNFLTDTALGGHVSTMAKADLLVPSVSAASIIAKVERDRHMAEQSELYPRYGFDSHAGYGTARHRAAIEQHGVTPLHRLSFAPLAEYRQGDSLDKLDETEGLHAKVTEKPTTRLVGDQSESVAAGYLERQGYKIIERNWRTRFCEIDIVAARNNTIYFVEVKHRKSSQQGDGLTAITPKKLQQMEFAARVYQKANKIKDTNLRLAAISTSGEDFAVQDFVLI